MRIEAASRTHRRGSYHAVEIALAHPFSCGPTPDNEALLALVVHGLMGQGGGHTPAQITVETMRRSVEAAPARWPAGEILAVALRAAHEELKEQARQHKSWGDIGATLAAVLIRDGKAAFRQLGDCRIYHSRAGVFAQLTEDDTLVAELSRRRPPPASADLSTVPDVLVKWLGLQEVPPGIEVLALQKGDVLLACTGGLSALLTPEQIARHMQADVTPQEICDALMEEAALPEAGRESIPKHNELAAVVMRAT